MLAEGKLGMNIS